jgi:hypothetical protein
MFCSRCEHERYCLAAPDYPEWPALCDRCVAELDEEAADTEWNRPEHQPVHIKPVERAIITFGDPRYRECYARGRSWRRYVA